MVEGMCGTEDADYVIYEIALVVIRACLLGRCASGEEWNSTVRHGN